MIGIIIPFKRSTYYSILYVCFLKLPCPQGFAQRAALQFQRQGSPVVVQMIAAGGRAEQAGVKPGVGLGGLGGLGRRQKWATEFSRDFFRISRGFFFQKSVLNAEARKQASKQARKQASKQASGQASQPASKQASKQRKARKARKARRSRKARMEVRMEVRMEASKQAIQRASKQARQAAREPASVRK